MNFCNMIYLEYWGGGLSDGLCCDFFLYQLRQKFVVRHIILTALFSFYVPLAVMQRKSFS